MLQYDFPGDFPHFKKLRFINDPKEGIAKSMRSTGELVVNKYYFLKLKPAHQFYILAHEEGHILYNTRDEMKADQHASDRYFETGRQSISDSVKALSEHLDRNNPVHIARAWAQYQRALKYDWMKNKNKKAYRPQYESVEFIKQKLQQNGKFSR
jgi:hypothetical protein